MNVRQAPLFLPNLTTSYSVIETIATNIAHGDCAMALAYTMYLYPQKGWLVQEMIKV